MDEFKDKVRELRRRRGWTQEDLARAVDVTLPTVQRWERGASLPFRLVRIELERLFREAGIDAEND